MVFSMPRGGSQAKFLHQAQGPLGGRAGAFLPSCRGVEEEAGEGEGEGCEVQGEVQGKAWKEAAKVSAKDTDP